MPINELEQHPFLNYVDFSKKPYKSFEKLIVGTFPVYHITDTVYPDDRIIKRFDSKEAYMKFFYGSKNNKFWNLISEIFEVKNPTDYDSIDERLIKAKELLENNKILISDVIKSTNRNGLSSEDNALWVDTTDEHVLRRRCINHNLDEMIKVCININKIYFTNVGDGDKTPFGKFKKIFGNRLTILEKTIIKVGTRLVSMEIKIDGRLFHIYFLPSPAGAGNRGLQFGDQRKTKIFLKYIQSTDHQFYQEITNIKSVNRTSEQKSRLTSLRKSFLYECWRQAIVHCNHHYDGDLVNY